MSITARGQTPPPVGGRALPLPPGPKGHPLMGHNPLMGHMAQWNADAMGFLTTCAREHGDAVPIRLGPMRFIVFSHPELVEEVLVTKHRSFSKGSSHRLTRSLLGNGLLSSEGDFWLRQRRLAQPAFHHQRIAAYADTMVRYAQDALAGWREGDVRELHEEMMGLTLAIAAKTLFDVDVRVKGAKGARGVGAAEFGRALATALERFDGRTSTLVLMLPTSLPLPGNVRFRWAVGELDRMVYEIIGRRRASGEDRGDLLSMLLAARDEDGRAMDDRQLRDEVITLLFAGHETTALTLTWGWYLLAQHPAAAAKLAEEATAVLDGRSATAEDVPRLTYAKAVVQETLRLYPPAPAVGREATEDCEIGGYRVKAKTSVLTSQWVIQRDGRFFERADSFEPERWLTSGAEGAEKPLEQRLPRFAYFPFGGGPRVCIGNQFATMEAILLLATIAQRYRLTLVPGQKVTPRIALTLRPHPGVRVRLERRDQPRAAGAGHQEAASY